MIMSTTLVGRGSGSIVGPAIGSVAGWVDAFLLIDTGGDAGAMDAALTAAGSRAVTARFDWVDDYSAARNFALDEATRLGATWAVTLDPDERLHLDRESVRKALACTSAGCLLLPEASGRYAKERFFRLPCPERFDGIVHEAFAAYRVGGETLHIGWFEELDKSPEGLAEKSRREVAMLRRQVAMAPDEPRWRYYLGDSLERTGDLEAAIGQYEACVDMGGWREEAAWACYRAAHCERALGNAGRALEWCGRGLAIQPGTPELAWTAALSEWERGDPAAAVAWARMAEALGDVAGCRASDGRIGFRHLPAAYEGPYDVLRFALRALGDEQGARDAEDRFHQARDARNAAAGGGGNGGGGI